MALCCILPEADGLGKYLYVILVSLVRDLVLNEEVIGCY